VESFHTRVLDRLLTEELPENAAVLEMGCGTGRLLHHLAPKQLQLYGIDMSSGMLSVARQRLGEEEDGAQLKEASVTDVPFDDDTFDGAYSILVVNLIPDFPKMFQEAARVLKPGGLFVFNVPNLASIYFPGGLYVNARGKTVGSNEVGHRYSHWFTPSEWKAALADAGLTVEKVLGQPPHLRLVDNASPLNAAGMGLLFSKSVYIQARRSAG
jgi:ubiquinone/menaquinone biosynthesis C-methylase UbiE